MHQCHVGDPTARYLEREEEKEEVDMLIYYLMI